MKQARNREEIEDFLASSSKTVFFFEADWCGDCRYIKPYLPQIEAENPHLTFVSVDRDDFMDLAKSWDIYGIPSLVVTQNGQELGRYVDKKRKSKEQITAFLEKF